jgi:hypothetical protein
MHDLFHAFQIPEVDNRLEDIEFAMNTLKQSFGDSPAMDPSMLTQLTANFNGILRQTSFDIHNRITERKYPKTFHSQICSRADSLSLIASQILQSAVTSPNQSISKNDLNKLFVQWRTLKPMFNQCLEPDKTVLNQYRGQIEPLMVKLQVVFAE